MEGDWLGCHFSYLPYFEEAVAASAFFASLWPLCSHFAFVAVVSKGSLFKSLVLFAFCVRFFSTSYLICIVWRRTSFFNFSRCIHLIFIVICVLHFTLFLFVHACIVGYLIVLVIFLVLLCSTSLIRFNGSLVSFMSVLSALYFIVLRPKDAFH